MPAPKLPFEPAKLPDPDFVPPTLDTATCEGWRVWRCSTEIPRYGGQLRLYSATHGNYYWVPRRVSVATCAKCGPKDQIPGEACTCGFYSAKTYQQLMKMGYHVYDIESGLVMILGQVANWGKVVECETGWRAAKSYPVRLCVPFEAMKLARPLQETYGVRVQLFNYLKPQAVM